MAAGFSPASVTRLWDFAPFFTLQPVDASRATQLEAWGRLVVALCAHRRQPRLALSSPEAEALFKNSALDPPRRLPEDGVRAVAAALVEAGRAEWAGAAAGAAGAAAAAGERSTLLVYERPPAEVAAQLDEWLRRNPSSHPRAVSELRNTGLNDGRMTDSPLWDLDGVTALRALEVLDREGKVDLANYDDGERSDPDAVQILRHRP